MKELPNLKIQVNGKHRFFLNQKIISNYSGRLKKMITEQNKKTQISNSVIKIDEFPGGGNGFELISRFCYNNGRISITPSNVSVLHCSAIFLEMTEEISPYNLLQQTETFLEGLFYWSWCDILVSLKSCDSFFSSVEPSGLLEKLISSLLSKISQKSDMNFSHSPSPSPSSYSSPETIGIGFRLSSSVKTTPESAITAKQSNNSTSTNKVWWFDELTILSPKIIEKIIKTMGFYGTDNNNLVITKFLLHYLKTTYKSKSGIGYTGLVETAVSGVVSLGKTAFSCRGLFWVQKMVSGFDLSRNSRDALERLIGEMLDEAKLDDLLVCGSNSGEVYDVNLILRLIRAFVISDGMTVQKMKKVGRLTDKYMREISPDQNLKFSKFLEVAESLPDCARDCFDGIYRAIEIYLESHPTISMEERSKLCKCLNFEKLTLEACKDLAKNIRIPPRISIEALISQQSKSPTKGTLQENLQKSETGILSLKPGFDTEKFMESAEEKEELKLNLQKMQWRVMELEKSCKEMKNKMSEIVKNKVIINSPILGRSLSKLF